MATQGQVKKIYRLETIGYDSLHKQFSTLSDDLIKLKKLIIELKGQSIGLKGDDLKKVNEQIIAAVESEKKLETQASALNTENQTSISTYFQLNKAYQAAKKEASDLAVSHGLEAEQTILAAEAAAKYKQQLIEINALIKSGGKTPAPIVPIAPVVTEQPKPIESITNVGGLNTEDLKKHGEVVTDLEKREAAEANAAFAMGQSNLDAGEKIKVAGVDVSAITTKYEEFTGSIRQNIIAQIENNNQLIVNRAAQKEIQTAINGQGFATDTQINKLASLKEEQQILTESNKALTVTIRNQTKEFIADAGSLDLFQAQLNQLQQAYEQLSAAEKASPFGQRMKEEIDILEPKVFALENELGKFQRRVGDYPRIWAGAFKTLETELDAVRGKLVSGNFSGAELANLTAKEQTLANATKVLGQQFASTAAQQAAFKEQGRQLALVFGTDSVVFKQFSEQVAIANTQLKKTDAQLTVTGNTGKGVFSKIYGGLRQIANVIPGLGISSLVLLLITPLESIASSIFKVGKASVEAAKDVNDFAESQKVLKEIIDEGIKGYAEETTRIEILGKIITNHALTIDKRNTAVAEYNKIADDGNKIDKESINNTALIEAAIGRQIVLIQKRALARAAENVIAKKAEELFLKQFELEDRFPAASEARIKELRDKAQSTINEASKKLNVKPASLNEVLSFVDLPKDVIEKGQKATAGLKVLLDQRTNTLLTSFSNQLKLIESNRKNVSGGNAGLQVLVDDIAKLNVELERVTKVGIGFISDVGGQLEKPAKTKDNFLQNGLKDIETARLQAVAIENKRTNEIEKIRALSFDEEIFHITELQRINVDALNKKIALFDTKKKLTSEEKKDRAEFGEQITAIELDTSKKINDIEKKRFTKNVDILQQQLDSELKNININKQTIIDNVQNTELQKAQAQLDADEQELQARKKFFNGLFELNSEFNQEALQKAKDAIKAQLAQVKKDQENVSTATLSEIRAAGHKQATEYEINYSLLRQKILENDKLTARQRKNALEKLAKLQNFTLLSNELAQLTLEFNKIAELYKQGLKTEQDYLDAKKKMEDAKEKQAAAGKDLKANKLAIPTAQGTQDFLKDQLSKTFGFADDSDESKLLGNVLAQSFSLAQDAMNAYFDAEEQRIRDNLAIQEERIDKDKNQAIARAQSQAEIDSLEKQAAEKKKKAEREAGEQLKKVKKSEAKIALATELGNLAVAAASNPANGVTFGVAGAVMYAVLAAIAFGRYALRVKEINSQQFEKGGIAGTAPTKTGGEIQGPSHKEGGVKFNYEAQGKELMIINKTSAQDTKVRTITGTNKQIASLINEFGGGISFAKGAQQKHFEGGGYLGTNLQAPVFTPSSNSVITQASNSSSEIVAAIKDQTESMNKQYDAVNKRVDRIKVNVVTKEITDSQNKQKQYSQVGTL